MELGTVLAECRLPKPPYGGDVMGQAQDRGWIKPFGYGQFIYTRPWVALLRRVQDMILHRAVFDLGFEEWMFPRMIPREALDAFQLTQFAPELLMQADPARGSFLDPVQCVAFYHHLRNSELDPERLPLKVVECLGGWTWRNESPDRLDGPYRAVEFARVEHVYIGTPEQVRTTRRAVQTSLVSMLTEIGLSWHLVVGKGCMDIPSILTAQHEACTPDEVPVQDIEVPIRGALKDDGWPVDMINGSHYHVVDGEYRLRKNDAFYLDADEICGCSVEGNHLVTSFNIRSNNDQELWSGCCGMGLNRLVVGILYQHGFDKSNWPDPLAAPSRFSIER